VSSTKLIFLGLGLGVLTGLFLGETASLFHVIAEGYIKLLQMTVLPYVMISLIAGLGSLTYQAARTLLVKVGGVVLVLWVVTLALVFLTPLAFPQWESASFFSTALIQKPHQIDFLNLYIPSNPFHSMANNIVPAVVLFCVIVGVALIGVDNKERLIDTLNAFNQALTRATRFIVKLTPIGVFAIAAHYSGTMTVTEFGRLQVFIITYVAVGFLTAFWVLPGLVSALSPVGYRELVGRTQDALVTAFMTANLFIVLPILIEETKQLLAKHGYDGEKAQSTPEVIVPTSFNFPHAGKILTLSFILFAGWFSSSDVAVTDYPKLAVSGILSLFGNINATVLFLLDLFRIPADMHELFVATGVVNSRVGSMVAAMHTLAVAVLGTCAIVGAIKVDGGRIFRYTVVTAVLTAVTIGGIRVVFSQAVDNAYEKDKILSGMHLMRDPLPATLYRNASDVPPLDFEGKSVLASIRDRGRIRVGYHERGLPYAYVNTAGELVGFDVEMAHRLAREMNVGLEFVPVPFEGVPELLDSGYCDIVMAGIAVTTERAEMMTHSAPYLNETLALVVRDHDRHLFGDVDEIRRWDSFRIGVPNLPYYVNMVRAHLPNAEVIVLNKVADYFEGRLPDVDAMLFTAERGSVWTILYPKFTVAVPGSGRVGVPLAYPVARHDTEMAAFVSTWIELKKNDGTINELFEYWIMGKSVESRGHRWSIIRDVLHWVD
jgi:Na+/H+-dicarboxylate symporter/ABC-type amino acid transport substrate-binding protein